MFGAMFAVMGLLIGLREGRLWTSIVGVATTAITVLIDIDIGSISRLYGPGVALGLPDDAISIGAGIWVVLAGAALGLTVSIVAMVSRSSEGPRH